jgi:hypothetical protein
MKQKHFKYINALFVVPMTLIMAFVVIWRKYKSTNNGFAHRKYWIKKCLGCRFFNSHPRQQAIRIC